MIVFAAIFMLAPAVSYGNVDFDPVLKTALKRVDNYVYVVDMSGSMMMKDEFRAKKISLAKEAMFNITSSVPFGVKAKSSILTVCPNGVVLSNEVNKMKTLDAIKNINEDKEIFGRMTNLDSGMKFVDKYLSENKTRKTAVFLVSDGDYNRGGTPIPSVEKLCNAHENVIFYVVDLSSTARGDKLFKEIVRLNKNSKDFDGTGFIDNAYAKRVAMETIFGEARVLNKYFKFDKYNVTRKESTKIHDVYSDLQKEFLVDNVNIQGWTDYIGTDAYNMKLSDRRANAVNKVFHNGKSNIENVKFYTEGCGKSYMFDNKTREGRAMNRRAAVFFF